MRPPLMTAVLLLVAAATAAAQDSWLGAEPRLRLQDPEPEEAGGAPLLDLGRFELNPRLGVLFFSEDFEADPEFAAGAMARVPAPAIAARLGAWVDLTLSSIDRDIDRLEDPDGVILFAGAGADYAFVDGEIFRLRAQLGAQFGYFGDVDDLDDGLAILAGVAAGLRVEDHVRITVNHQVAFADAGDRVFFLHAGLTIDF